MNSLITIYSKFTEEFLLFSAACFFALLSVYCYYWVIQKRRLGVARSQVPSAVVKSYLGQLIQEAETVRKQLFGMTDGSVPTGTSSIHPSGNIEINPDLLARITSLESQLKDKESLVVNINIEKNKLLQEIENLKTGTTNANASLVNQNEMVEKIKLLEARLDEYSLFEEDLANLKRLQQENADLKKKISEASGNTSESTKTEPSVERKHLSAVPALEPEPASKPTLDQGALKALLSGESATPPENEISPATTNPEPKLTESAASETTASNDQFENLVDSVENSLDASNSSTPTPAEDNVTQISAVATKEASKDESADNKSDEELLKEFENLLNS